ATLTGTFHNLSEGSVISAGGQQYTISYLGNRVTVTAQGGASATTLTWTGAVDSNWSTPGNWSPALSPVHGDDLIFTENATNLTNHNNFHALTANSLTFQGAQTGNGYSIDGFTLTIGSGGITDASTTTGNEFNTIGCNLILNSTVNVTVNDSNT